MGARPLCGQPHPDHPEAKCRKVAGHRGYRHASLIREWVARPTPPDAAHAADETEDER